MTKLLDWKAAVSAGLVAGLVFLMLEMLLVQMLQPMSMWAPPRMMAAMVMGQGVLPPPDTFHAGAVMVAMLIHFPLSIVYAVILGTVIRRWTPNQTMALGAGLFFGLLLYVINFYGFTAVFPWFANARNWISILAHAIYGVTLAAVYHRLDKRPAVPTV